jgi:photosystem II stability/assembly factor-like uncharacterized protein
MKMKTKIIKLIILFVVFISSYTQGGWVLQNTGTTTFISSISFPNESTGFASGWSSTILKTTNSGTNWVFLSSPVSASYSSIFFVDVNTGWLVGSSGTIIKTTNSGLSWQTQISNTTTLLMLTNFVDAQTGYVVGYSGVILKTTNGGNIWVSQNSGVTVNLLSVKFINSETGYVTGDLSRILKTTDGGTTWVSLVSGLYNNLGKIAVTSSTTAFVPATDGTVFRTTNGGNYWIAQSSGTSNYLVSANFPSTSIGYISGSNGSIIKSTNSGINWVLQTTPVTVELHWVYFINNLTGWATGYGGTIIKTTDGGVGSSIPSAPQLISPPNNSLSQPLTPTMIWSNTGGDYYKIQISTNTTFNVISDSATVTSTQYTVPSGKLQTGITYFWRVNASNSAGTSAWSSVWNFATYTGPEAPILLSPANGAINVSLTPVFSWSNVSSATYYLFEISTDSLFVTIKDSASVTANQFIMPSGILIPGTVYFWRVIAYNNNGSGPWSTVFRFTTLGVPLTPNLIYPTNGMIGVSPTPTLDWDSIAVALYYKVQISTVSNFAIITDSATITASQYTVPAGKLQLNYTYFWRVNASNASGTSPWSSTWYFTVSTIGLITTGNIIPDNFKLYSNYPNPFNPATKIRFDIPKSTLTKLIVYDALGRTVETLVNKELSAGTYEYTWNASKYNSGIYFLRIVSDKFVETRKMVLLK